MNLVVVGARARRLARNPPWAGYYRLALKEVAGEDVDSLKVEQLQVRLDKTLRALKDKCACPQEEHSEREREQELDLELELALAEESIHKIDLNLARSKSRSAAGQLGRATHGGRRAAATNRALR